MKRSVIAGILLAAVLAAGCGEQYNEMRQAIDNVQSIAGSAEQAQQTMDKVQQRIQQRRAAGDTIPIAYEELQKRLRDVTGWTGEASTGESMSMPGLALSTATRAYTKGKARIVITLHDYAGSPEGYTGATMVFALAMKIDNATQRTETFQTANPLVNGMMEYYKSEGRGTVTWAIAGRFVLQAEAAGITSIEDVRAFGDQFGIDALASL